MLIMVNYVCTHTFLNYFIIVWESFINNKLLCPRTVRVWIHTLGEFVRGLSLSFLFFFQRNPNATYTNGRQQLKKKWEATDAKKANERE